SPLDIFVAAVHKSSQMGCFGDGTSGACPCGNTVTAGLVSGCRATATGVGVRLDDQGISSLGSDSLRFYAVNLPPSGVALLLQGHPGVALPFQDGLSCMSGPLLRIYSATFQNSALDLAPAGGARVHSRSAALGDPILAGTSRAYQLYFRGPATGLCQAGNGNLSNSVVVDWTP
ncbi:MAG TPA: hypothetical protein VM509_11235, partial [Planctomycetota bacterium]|nr:hypothetical protein [Planctomycetota bacterium]